VNLESLRKTRGSRKIASVVENGTVNLSGHFANDNKKSYNISSLNHTNGFSPSTNSSPSTSQTLDSNQKEEFEEKEEKPIQKYEDSEEENNSKDEQKEQGEEIKD